MSHEKNRNKYFVSWIISLLLPAVILFPYPKMAQALTLTIKWKSPYTILPPHAPFDLLTAFYPVVILAGFAIHARIFPFSYKKKQESEMIGHEATALLFQRYFYCVFYAVALCYFGNQVSGDAGLSEGADLSPQHFAVNYVHRYGYAIPVVLLAGYWVYRFIGRDRFLNPIGQPTTSHTSRPTPNRG